MMIEMHLFHFMTSSFKFHDPEGNPASTTYLSFLPAFRKKCERRKRAKQDRVTKRMCVTGGVKCKIRRNANSDDKAGIYVGE